MNIAVLIRNTQRSKWNWPCSYLRIQLLTQQFWKGVGVWQHALSSGKGTTLAIPIWRHAVSWVQSPLLPLWEELLTMLTQEFVCSPSWDLVPLCQLQRLCLTCSALSPGMWLAAAHSSAWLSVWLLIHEHGVWPVLSRGISRIVGILHRIIWNVRKHKCCGSPCVYKHISQTSPCLSPVGRKW